MFGLAEMQGVRAAVGRFAAGFDPAVVPPADVLRIVEEAAAAENMLATVKALAARQLAETEVWRRSGDASAAHHLARTSGSSVAKAREALAAAEHLGELPALEAAARRGELSAAQVAPVADAAAKAPAAEGRLVELARSSSLGELLDACARTKAAAEPDADARRRTIHAGRFLRRRRCEDGAGELHYRSTLDEVAEIYAVVRGYADRRFRAARAEGRREPAEAYLADGLLDAARASVAPGTGATARNGASHGEHGDHRTGVASGVAQEAAGAEAPGAEPGGRPVGEAGAAGGEPGAEASGAEVDGRPDGERDVGGEPGAEAPAPEPDGRPADEGGVVAGPFDTARAHAGVHGHPTAGGGESNAGGIAQGAIRSPEGSDLPLGRLFGDARGEALAPATGPPAGTGPPDRTGRPDGSDPESPPSPVPAKVVVRVDWDALVRGWPIDGEVCEIAGLGPVAVSAVRAMIGSGNAVLAAVVTKGVDVVNVAHLGRRATAFQRSALEWRGPSCAVVGCNTTEGLEIDHTEDWATSKLTLLGLLERMCSHHHDLKTRQGWALVDGVGKRPMVPPGDPRHPRHIMKRSGRPEDSDAA